MKLKYFKELDGIRAIAALMVMFFHFFNAENNVALIGVIKSIVSYGQTGVALFFVLSGFLITRLLLNTKESPAYFSSFYVRRILRIFPLYYFFLILFYFILPLLEGKTIAPFSSQVYFWTYLQNIALTFKWDFYGPNHFWSLAVEEHFYLFWPILIFFLNKKSIKKVIIVIIIAAVICRVFLLKNNLSINFFTFTRMDDLAIGALLAVLEFEGKLKSIKPIRFLFLLIILIVVAVLLNFTQTNGSYINETFKYTIMAFCYFSIIGYVLSSKEESWVHRILKNSVLSYTGKISYGLYVYHPLCILLLQHYFRIDSIFISFFLSFGLAYLIATISFYLMESKFLSLKKYFEYNKPKTVAADKNI